MRFQSTFLIIAVLSFSGCASTVPSKWYNSQIKDSSQRMRQQGEDTHVCLGVAQGMAPMPSARTYVPPPPEQAYNFRGQITTYGANGIETSTVRGRATPAPSFASGFASGYNVGSAMAEDVRWGKVTEAYVLCMKTLGWTDKPADGESRGDGIACKGHSECEGSLVCAKVSESSMKCMTSDAAIRLN